MRFKSYLFYIVSLLYLSPLSASSSIQDIDPKPLQTHRLVSDTDHTDFLQKVLNTAVKQVMISSYQVTPQRLFEDGIADSIIQAAERGVAIYIYYDNRPYLSNDDYQDLCAVASYCAKFEENSNHSKCVIKDADTVAIGSYNWLSDSWGTSLNASIVYSGFLATGLINNIWEGVRFYQSIKYENERGQNNFFKNKDAFSTGSYEFKPGQFLYTLRTPEGHGQLLEDVFAKAHEKVFICSPFIRLNKLQTTFTPQLLRCLKEKNVQVTLMMLPKPYNKDEVEQAQIFNVLNQLQKSHSNFSYVTQENIHAKTLIADEDFILEGSFNWLSAVADTDHEANNFEMSAAVRGPLAAAMIREFKHTKMGSFFNSSRVEPSHAPIKQYRHYGAKRKTHTFNRSRGKSGYSPEKLNSQIKVFSGDRFDRDGYCVKINGNYLRDPDTYEIEYFSTYAIAQKVAYSILNKGTF